MPDPVLPKSGQVLVRTFCQGGDQNLLSLIPRSNAQKPTAAWLRAQSAFLPSQKADRFWSAVLLHARDPDLASTTAGSAQASAFRPSELSIARAGRANSLGTERSREFLTGTACEVTMSLPLALTLCVGASQKSGQVLVRTYVLKHAEFPKVYWGMSGVLKLCKVRKETKNRVTSKCIPRVLAGSPCGSEAIQV